MIISPNRRFVYVHLHKCAGTSIEMALAGALGINDLVLGSTPDGERQQGFFKSLIGLGKHASAADALAVLGEKTWREFFTFGFVRHPVDRLRSLHAYSLKLAAAKPLGPAEQARLAEGGGFPDRPPYRFKAVQAALQTDSFDAFLQHPLTWQDPGAQPQWRGLCNEAGELLVNFVGKVEQIEQDWAKVEQNLSVKLALPLANRTEGRVPQPLSAESMAMVRERLGRDFELFGYTV